MNLLDMRVWGVWDPVISRLEYLSQSYNDCNQILKLHTKAGRLGLEIIRFDLSAIDRDREIQRKTQKK